MVCFVGFALTLVAYRREYVTMVSSAGHRLNMPMIFRGNWHPRDMDMVGQFRGTNLIRRVTFLLRKPVLWCICFVIRVPFDSWRIEELDLFQEPITERQGRRTVARDVRSCNSRAADLRCEGMVIRYSIVWPSRFLFGCYFYECNLVDDLCRTFDFTGPYDYQSLFNACSRFCCANIPSALVQECITGSIIVYFARRSRFLATFRSCPELVH